jgi:hypothetical protein
MIYSDSDSDSDSNLDSDDKNNIIVTVVITDRVSYCKY